jgi:hypothetical protein
MNVADIAAALTFLTCGIGSAAASRSAGAPVWVSIVALLLGLCFGFLGAFVTGKTAYRLLRVRSRGFMEMLTWAVYCAMPVIGILVFGGISIVVTSLAMKSLGYEALH